MLEPELGNNNAPVFKPGYSPVDYQQMYIRNLDEVLVLLGITINKLSDQELDRFKGISRTPRAKGQ